MTYVDPQLFTDIYNIADHWGVPAIEIIFFILRNITYMDILCIALYESKYKYTLHFYV